MTKDNPDRRLGQAASPFVPARDVIENPRRHLGDAVTPPPRREVDDGKGSKGKE